MSSNNKTQEISVFSIDPPLLGKDLRLHIKVVRSIVNQNQIVTLFFFAYVHSLNHMYTHWRNDRKMCRTVSTQHFINEAPNFALLSLCFDNAMFIMNNCVLTFPQKRVW